MNKLLSLFAKKDEFQNLLEKVKRNEEVAAKTYAKESRYESPFDAIRSGSQVNTRRLYTNAASNNFCFI